MHIVDDEQRSDRRATPMRPSGSGLEGADAGRRDAGDVGAHRRGAPTKQMPLPSQERGPFQFSDRLLDRLKYRSQPAMFRISCACDQFSDACAGPLKIIS
jgi:hypothetical protein